MKFPGSKLLHRWDLPGQRVNLNELLASSRSSGLTGMIEVMLPGAVGLVFYYLGGEVNALYREGVVAHNGRGALQRLRSKPMGEGGSVAVFELPLDLAHLLRGIIRRRRLREAPRNPHALKELLSRLRSSEHTGTLEVQNAAGSAIVLIVRGRVSNVYWEAVGGPTFEKGEARQKLDAALASGEVKIFLAEFSREAWKARHGVEEPIPSPLQRSPARHLAPAQSASEEMAARRQILEELQAEVPALLQSVMFDMMTGAIFLRGGPGLGGLEVSPLPERLPALTRHIKDQLADATEGEPLEFVEISSEHLSTFVAVVTETQEAIALLADRSQPATLVQAALLRATHAYADRLHPSPGGAAA